MKKKFITLTLCFTIIFSSINYKKSYANPLLFFTPEIVATISALAVGSGIVLTTNDDVLDITRIFYEKNKENWDNVETLFKVGCVLGANKIVTVSSEFLSLFQSTFDDYFSTVANKSTSIGSGWGVPYIGSFGYDSYVKPATLKSGIKVTPAYNKDLLIGNVFLKYTNSVSGGRAKYDTYLNGELISNYCTLTVNVDHYFASMNYEGVRSLNYSLDANYGSLTYSLLTENSVPYTGYDIPYVPGSYDWDKVKSNTNEDGSVGVYVPGNAGSLPGIVGGDTIVKPGISNPPYDLTDGTVAFPGIANPSLDIGDSIAFPGVANPPIDVPIDPPIDVPIDPPIDIPFPAFPSFGDTLDFSPMEMTNITDKFPFSLPWDISRLINKFDVEPKAPIFKVPIVTEEIVLDLTMFDKWANITRFFVLIGFTLSLIFISTKLKG